MFNLIPPKKREEYSKEIKQMFSLIEREHGKSARDEFDHDQTHYLIYSHKKFGVIGGARLIPIDQPVLTSDLLKRLQFKSNQKIWEMSRIFFHLPSETAKDESEKMFNLIRQDFYQNMYDSLKTISIAQKIKAFITVLPTEGHKDILNMGLWPFEKQAQIASPFKDSRSYILGIMPMNAQTYEAFVHRRRSSESILRIS